MLYRRFGFLHSRILLYKQDELGHLEKKLDDLDHQDLLLDKRCLKDRIRDDAREPQTRKQLLDLIEERLLKYDEILLKSKEVAALNRPSKRDYESVKSYLQIEKPFFKSGLQFIRCKEDFITLRPGRGSAWVDGFFEDILRHIHWRPLTNLFSNEEHRAKSDNLDLHYHSKKRFSVFIGLTLGILILLLLVLPVYILYQLSTEANRTFVSVGLMLVFTLLFSIVLSVFTKAKRQEILAASAA
ncbi:MAG: hypothetical protein M1827_002158 [Pycnora praestabilis]|nr:MAG: hypothetical protein M1827_002158 [Pycnora praestabilis]